MNFNYDLDDSSNVESLLEQIENDFLVSTNRKPAILNILRELFNLKQTAAPSEIEAKWSELHQELESLTKRDGNEAIPLKPKI